MKTSQNTEMAVAVSLAAVLDVFKLPLPFWLFGGSISLEALPLLIIALRRGPGVGFVTGAAYGVVNLLLRPIVVHPLQLFLDYPIAFGLLGGGSGAFINLTRSRSPEDEGVSINQNTSSLRISDALKLRIKVLIGILAGNALRLAAHFLSGVIFFSAYAPADQSIWVYSLVYNMSYIVPQTIMHICLLQIILRIIYAK